MKKKSGLAGLIIIVLVVLVIGWFQDNRETILIIAASIAVLALILAIAKSAKLKKQAEIQRQAAIRAEREEAERQYAEEMERKRRFEKLEAAIEQAINANPAARAYRLSDPETALNYDKLTITDFTPISKKRYVAFDFETTGLSAIDDEIVEIGAVRVENGEITAEYSQLIDPERPMPLIASQVNHITDDMLRGQPKIYEALPTFLAFVGDDVLAAHNASFDMRFLFQACVRARFKTPGRVFDTMTLARYWPDVENRKLATLLMAAGIKNDEEHRALGDARALAALVKATNEKRKKK